MIYTENQYAIVVDAGSSGTRMYGYQRKSQYSDDDIIINQIFKHKSDKKGGIQTLGSDHALDSDSALGPNTHADGLVGARVEKYFGDLFSKYFSPQKRVKITTTGSQPEIPEMFQWLDKFDGRTETKVGKVTTIVEPAELGGRLIPHSSKDKKNYTLTVMATGGMRDFQKENATKFGELEEKIKTYIKGLDKSVFKSATYQTITGKEEALYGWAASNYLLRKLPKVGIKKGLVNYLEMGGATAQIAFRSNVHKELKAGGANLNPTSFKGKLMRVHIWGKEIDLYLRTYPLGSDSALATHETAVQSNSKDGGPDELIDRCKPRSWAGDLVKRDKHGKPTGNGKDVVSAKGPAKFDYAKCKQLSVFLLRYQMYNEKSTTANRKSSDPEKLTYPEPEKDLPDSGENISVDLLAGSPGLTSRSQFVGGANFYYTTRSTFGRDDWGHPKEMAHNYLLLDKEVKERAVLSYDQQVERSKKRTLDPVEKEYLVNGLFTAVWVATVLKGFGIWEGEKEINFQPYNGPTKEEADHRPELSWTLGAAFLDACEQSRKVKGEMLQVVSSKGVHKYKSGYHVKDEDGCLLDSVN